MAECTFNQGGKIDIPNTIENVIDSLVDDLKLFERSEVFGVQNKIVQYAYPVYSIGCEQKVREIISEVESRRLRTAGRQGRFEYWSSSECVKDAISLSETIVDEIKKTEINQSHY